jgi:signal peptidase I
MADQVEGVARISERRRSVRTIVAIAAGSLLFVLPLCLRAFFIEAFKTPSPSMAPTLLVGDHFFVMKSAYGWFDSELPARGNVIVFRFPERPEQDFVKRVVGLPGDRLLFKGGEVYINGWKVPSCEVGKVTLPGGEAPQEGTLRVEYLGAHAYLIFHDQRNQVPPEFDEQGPYDVADDQVFVIGDNRENSHDSRGWYEGRGGGVPRGHVKGRAGPIWMAFGAQGIVWSRVGTSVDDPPACLEFLSKATCEAIARCVAQRPPMSATSPPGRGGGKG